MPECSLDDTPICVLDLDGSVQHENVVYRPGFGIYMAEPGHHLFEWTDILIRLLQPYPDVRIVLSTSWVRKRGYQFTKRQLPAQLKDRVVGATFHTRETPRQEFDLQPRWLQIVSYVERKRVARWFAIDDDVEGWPAWAKHRLVATAGETGISTVEVQERIAKVLSTL